MKGLYHPYIKGVLDKHCPKRILEIGVAAGFTTTLVLDWCLEHDAHLTSIEPMPWQGELPDELKPGAPSYVFKRDSDNELEITTPTFVEEFLRTPKAKHWTCIKDYSQEYLSQQETLDVDLYLIDGDHNYYTCYQELTLMWQRTTIPPVILLHDIGKWGRRDQYYDHTRIPPDFLNGAKQGVLTAIEDFIRYSQDTMGPLAPDQRMAYKRLTHEHHGLGMIAPRPKSFFHRLFR